ncbi:mannitol dehydrogenase family protein [Rathayibacter sp. VKM Ac-2760]|uniref:mannitol dehydrogenase family protein n=1 Tax=Rathayibacter sp. VKM Ac-2760 TaxID=2609253 RepID=UPI001318FBD2|nr:mannitol dehydrogenase family protein [Rathayibacter sp. VKM Ac-2760]QHC58799.1 mannitol dehydrogenase family protein [Rathayibacter sp. VKM Ac-2760]
MSTTTTTPGTRLVRAVPAPPVRIVHLGLGAFSRSHTAWYTQASADGDDWGIAAYTGRSRDLADRLTRQDGLYTLVERAEDGDRAEVIGSVARAHAGDDLPSLLRDLSAPETAVVTLTITEIGYRLGADGGPDLGDPLVRRDRDELAAVAGGRLAPQDAAPETAVGRLLLGLESRRRAEGGPIAIVSCDNLPDNGGRLARGVSAWVEGIAPELAGWLDAHASFVATSIDRITPRISAEEDAVLRARYGDDAPVVAEPFHDWVLSGRFPVGRPAWESAGARFVDDLDPWESRKLWLLNGAHTLLAALGRLRGHETVAAAVADPVCRAAVDALWDDAATVLPADLGIPEYREALLERFSNPRIEHRLQQIGQDTETKLRLRIVPVAELVLAAGGRAEGSTAALGACLAGLRRGLVGGSPADVSARALVEGSSPALLDGDILERVEQAASAFPA